MKLIGQIAPYHPLPPAVLAAVEKLERAETFDAPAFAVLNNERWKRAPIFLGYALPCMAIGVGLVWLADLSGWLPSWAVFMYGLFPIIFTAITCNLIRGRSFLDEQRLGRAIGRWEYRGKMRDKPVPLDKAHY